MFFGSGGGQAEMLGGRVYRGNEKYLGGVWAAGAVETSGRNLETPLVFDQRCCRNLEIPVVFEQNCGRNLEIPLVLEERCR